MDEGMHGGGHLQGDRLLWPFAAFYMQINSSQQIFLKDQVSQASSQVVTENEAKAFKQMKSQT